MILQQELFWGCKKPHLFHWYWRKPFFHKSFYGFWKYIHREFPGTSARPRGKSEVWMQSGCRKVTEAQGLSQPLEGLPWPPSACQAETLWGSYQGNTKGLSWSSCKVYFQQCKADRRKSWSSKRLSDLIRVILIYDIISLWPLSAIWVWIATSWSEAETFSPVFLI